MAQDGNGSFKRIWSPVRQQAADSFLILLIIAFAVTVIIVRVFLELSGYPQIGDSTFHIAHLLWGGLLLFVAVVIVLLWANHWVLWTAAVGGGIGVGLFMDEVGKFITKSNDYFFPLAFPIIYAFFLACVWLYVRVRRSTPRDTRTMLYHALEDLKQVLDHDLDPFEYKNLTNELTAVLAQTQSGNEKKLAQALLDFVHAEDLALAKEPNVIERGWERAKQIASRWPPRRLFKWLLIVGFAWAAITSLVEVSALWAFFGGLFQNTHLPTFVITSGKMQYELRDPILILVHTTAILITGALCALTAVLFLVRRERGGLRLGSLAMILSLTIVSLLTFYFSQLYAIGDAVSQMALLLGATIYRWRFYLNK